MKKEIENISKIILQCIEEDEGLKMIWNEDTLCFGIRTLKKSCLSLFWWSDKGGKERTQFYKYIEKNLLSQIEGEYGRMRIFYIYSNL